MPSNRITVEFEGGAAKCRVWGGDGTEHDASGIFQQIRDLTAKDRASASLSLTGNSLQTTMTFAATKKELIFEVAPAVIEQILQMIP